MNIELISAIQKCTSKEETADILYNHLLIIAKDKANLLCVELEKAEKAMNELFAFIDGQ